MSSEHCGPCKETGCIEVTDGEAGALKDLYQRMLDKQCPAPRDSTPAPPSKEKPTFASECTRTGRSQSLLKKFDVLMTTAMDSRTAGTSDSGTDKAALPDPVTFAKCRQVPPGKLNSALFGIDVERALVGPQAERDGLSDAADALLIAEAACKHSGAVAAAQIAALKQPEAKHAEDAARIGAKAYAAADVKTTGGNNTENPIEVVGYVGCTRPPVLDIIPDRVCD